MEVQELNPGLLEEQQVLSTMKPPFYPTPRFKSIESKENYYENQMENRIWTVLYYGNYEKLINVYG